MAQFIEMVPLAEEAIPLLEEGAAATGRVLSRVGGAVRRTAAGRAIAREAEQAARYIGRAGIRRAAGVTRSAGRDLASEVGGVSRALLRKYGGAYRVAQRGASALGTAATMYGLGRKFLGKRTLKSRPGPMKKKKRKLHVMSYKPTMAYKVADTGRRFRKGKRPPLSAKYVKRNYDDYGTQTRDHSLWAGFQTHGSRTRITQIAAEALLRALLSRVDRYPSVYDEVMGNGGDIYDVVIRWNKYNADDGSTETVDKTYSIEGGTFEAIATAIANDWAGIAAGTTKHAVPVRATFRRQEYTTATSTFNQNIRVIEDIDQMKLFINVAQTVRVQNLSPNDAGTDLLDVNGTNPVQGKLYEFTTPPIVRERVQDIHSGLRKFHDWDDGVGVYTLGNITETGVDGVLGHPPPAGGLFTNCRKVANVKIAAGGQKYKRTTFSFKGSVLEFCRKFRFSNESNTDSQAFKKHGGGIIWIGLEQAFRQGADTVKIGFNRELNMSARAQFAKKRPMLKHYEQTDLGDTV